MRRNIFEILSNDFDFEEAVNFMNKLFTQEHVVGLGVRFCTIAEYVEYYCFKQWKSRGYCITMQDFLIRLDFYNLRYEAVNNFEKFIIFSEIVYNFWFLVENACKRGRCHPNDDFYLLKNFMDEFLAKFNYVASYRKNEEQVILVEDKPEVTAVAEIVTEELIDDVIRYNHHILKGDIVRKKAILLRLGTELEPKREKIEKVNKQLASNVFYMLNNFNLRHNNCVEGENHYIKHIAEMGQDEIEKWYDELYQMMLLCFLLIDNIERNEKISQIKITIQNNA